MNDCFSFLENAVRYRPNKIAIIDENESLTYQDVFNIATNMSLSIDSSYIKEPIVVLMKKSALAICAFMGILYSENFYVPLDCNMPVERIKKILDEVNPRYIIADNRNQDMLEKEISKGEFYIINLESDRDTSSNCCFIKERETIPDDSVYVMYTSGSTGRPKGVEIAHRGVLDYISWAVDQFLLNEDMILGNQAPFHFDNSIFDIFGTFAACGTLVIIPQIYFSFPKNLISFLNEKKVNLIFWVPSAIKCLDNYGNKNTVEKLEYISKILFCGEVMTNSLLNRIRQVYPSALYANLYGPTEITDACTFYIVDRCFEDQEPLPIGLARKNAKIYLIDDNKVIKNGSGEICVSGSGVALGYFKNEELTKKSFVMLEVENGTIERVYKTGDLGYYQDDLLFFIGRRDEQVKRNGYRIELGEIDNIMALFSTRIEVASIFDSVKNSIILFYSGAVNEQDLREWAKTHLPIYMNPDVYVQRNNMPRKANMKIDKKELKHELSLYEI